MMPSGGRATRFRRTLVLTFRALPEVLQNPSRLLSTEPGQVQTGRKAGGTYRPPESAAADGEPLSLRLPREVK